LTRRVVLDTNVIVSGLGWPGPSAQILDAGLAGRLVLITSPALISELRRVLAYPKLAAVIPDPEVVADLIEAVAVLVDPERTITAVSDQPDNRVLEAAVHGTAGYIVSGDKHLLALGVFADIPILTPVTFASLKDE